MFIFAFAYKNLTMATFIGTYFSKVDDEGRLVFPAPLKAAIPAGGDMRFVIKKIDQNVFGKFLKLAADS